MIVEWNSMIGSGFTMNDRMETIDAAYIAGLFDGKGCIGIYNRR